MGDTCCVGSLSAGISDEAHGVVQREGRKPSSHVDALRRAACGVWFLVRGSGVVQTTLTPVELGTWHHVVGSCRRSRESRSPGVSPALVYPGGVCGVCAQDCLGLSLLAAAGTARTQTRSQCPTWAPSWLRSSFSLKTLSG